MRKADMKVGLRVGISYSGRPTDSNLRAGTITSLSMERPIRAKFSTKIVRVEHDGIQVTLDEGERVSETNWQGVGSVVLAPTESYRLVSEFDYTQAKARDARRAEQEKASQARYNAAKAWAVQNEKALTEALAPAGLRVYVGADYKTDDVSVSLHGSPAEMDALLALLRGIR